MSLQQALQARKAKVQPTSSRGASAVLSKAGKAVPVGQSASASEEERQWFERANWLHNLLTIKNGVMVLPF